MASGGGYVNYFFFLFWSWPVRGNLHTLQRKLMAKHMCRVGQKKGALCGAKLSLSAVYRAVVFRLNQLISAKFKKGEKRPGMRWRNLITRYTVIATHTATNATQIQLQIQFRQARKTIHNQRSAATEKCRRIAKNEKNLIIKIYVERGKEIM